MDAERLKKEIGRELSDFADLSTREVRYGERTVTVMYLSGMCAKSFLNRYVLEPIISASASGHTALPIDALITNNKVDAVRELEAAVEAILEGSAFVFSDGMTVLGYAVSAKNEAGRSVSEPETENVIRGPHEGFTESAENNAMLIRRRIRSKKLKKKEFQVGSLSKTTVAVMYMDGIADENALEEICRRIEGISTDAILDSGYVEMFIQDGRYPFYPTVGNSERPDKVAGKLLEGRIAVIVDGSPVVLTMPYLFIEAFQVTEDYTKSPWYASFVRVLRFLAYLVSLYFPALFVAAFVRHRQTLPAFMIEAIDSARETLSFSIFWEVLIIFLIFETVREVGLRMPKAVGSAVGLVGSLILGDSAIKAGLTSAPVLVVVALAAVCNFMVPPYMNANMLYRLFMIVISGAMGYFGFFSAIFLTVVILAGKHSLGVPYLSPMAPISPSGLRDFLYMAPLPSMEKIPASITGKRLTRRGKGGKGDDA